ncbi:MAG TPA: adenylosuccinate lyase [Acidimicrobiales bacterium]|nr:adenylosuccinate lyase [Acidimicrobiales bacterium]
MIPRYSLPEMAALFSDETKFRTWLEIEVLAVEAWSQLGVVPVADAVAVRERSPAITAATISAIAERERVTDHDVAAFVDVVQDAIGPPAGAWVHYGLTSSDVVDTALGVTLRAAADRLLEASGELVSALERRARELADVAMVGRTHGIHAEPITFGAKLALWCLQADRDRRRLEAARRAVSVGKLSGAVGTYSNIDPAVETRVCAALGLRPVPATQVVARDRHAEYLWACASVGASVESFATEIRHLQRTEVGEVEEPFASGQKGSSAMPHKRNPIVAERLTGLARVLRGYVGPGLEDVALWHERDISHSSVERVILPDASLLAYYVLRKMTALVDGLVVHPDRMRENLDRSHGLVFSQAVLLALVASGMDRDSAYRIVQRDARLAWDESKPLRMVLESDPEVPLGPGDLDDAFSIDRALRHARRPVDALDTLGSPDEEAP